MPARVMFNEFKDSSLNIFAIYWYHPADWWAYCAFSEWVNMEILKRFNAALINGSHAGLVTKSGLGHH